MSTNRLSSLFRFKDVIRKEEQFHIVYKFRAVTVTLLTMAKLTTILK